MGNPIKPGQHFTWNATKDSTVGGEAVVKDVKTNRQEGLSTETDAYVSLWIEATGLSGSRKDQSFEVILGTDSKSYLDGEAITVKVSD